MTSTDFNLNVWEHEKFLYPVVRVHAQKAAGSGTIIYSEPDPKEPEEFITLVLTNYHVIESLIARKTDWNSIVKRKIEQEFIEMAHVENFIYRRRSTVDSSNRYNADILAYDQQHDLAILKIESPREFTNKASLLPKGNIKELYLYDDVVITGCSLAHDPFSSFGKITYLNEVIDREKYTMTSASAIFGSSGGALFLRRTGELIGVPSRITAIQLGFGVDVITWMSFAAAPERLYKFMEDQELHFIFDNNDDFHSAMERRNKRQLEALRTLKAEFIRDEESASGESKDSEE